MIYATRATIAEIYGDDFLTDLTPDGVADPDAAIDRALVQASAEIDGWISARYKTPLASAPKTLERPCIDIAAYILANSHARLTVTIEDRYKYAVDFAKAIGAGRAGLGDAEPSAAVDTSTGTAAGADFSANPRRFGVRARG
ncbi:phage protein Gp36 family protein [Rhodobacter capsulatus]|uniref:phage protein Gp36 family protein n=1 Tax=Rhodobacter capsulatus TaxID=1061 RepID=UPI0040271E37